MSKKFVSIRTVVVNKITAKEDDGMMGSVCTKVGTDRRESGTESESQKPRLQHHGICTRRYPNANKSESASVYSTKNRRTRHSAGGCSTDADGNSTKASARINGNVSAVSNERTSGRNVKFGDTTMIYTPMDWPPDAYRDARKGPWISLAADRCRFNRRIKQTECVLGDIFCDAHRENVKRRLFDE